jgi:small-conductance mechanosensitive channel
MTVGASDMILSELTPQDWQELGISVLILAVAIVAGRWIVHIVLDQIVRRLVGRTETKLDDTIFKAIKGPLHLFVVILAFDIGLRRLEFLPEKWSGNLDNIFYVLYFGIGTYFLIKLLSGILDWYGTTIAGKDDLNQAEQMLPFLRRIVVIIVALIAIVSVLQQFTDVSALLATLGVGSLAIAFAAQTALEDLFSGFLIMFDRPFLIGDRIEIMELNTWGDVMDISLRSTRVRTRDNRWVIIPNSVIGKSMVVNYSRPDTEYRIQIEMGLAYGIEVPHARETIINAVRSVDGVLTNRRVEALFLRFGENALVFRVRWWLDSYYDARRMFDKVNTAIYEALNEQVISISPPLQVDTYHHVSDQTIEQVSKLPKKKG